MFDPGYAGAVLADVRAIEAGPHLAAAPLALQTLGAARQVVVITAFAPFGHTQTLDGQEWPALVPPRTLTAPGGGRLGRRGAGGAPRDRHGDVGARPHAELSRAARWSAQPHCAAGRDPDDDGARRGTSMLAILTRATAAVLPAVLGEAEVRLAEPGEGAGAHPRRSADRMWPPDPGWVPPCCATGWPGPRPAWCCWRWGEAPAMPSGSLRVVES